MRVLGCWGREARVRFVGRGKGEKYVISERVESLESRLLSIDEEKEAR